MKHKLRLAVLDLYESTPNQGMRAIKDLLYRYRSKISYDLFDVRSKNEVPTEDYDIYISSGGPGDPRKCGASWEPAYYGLLDRIWERSHSRSGQRPYLFLICHSFQMACAHFGVAEITKRKSKSFGTFPVHKTDEGRLEPIFEGLPNPFIAADFRSYQVVQPKVTQIEKIGAKILALEKIRPHVPLERAIMAVRFSDTIVGVQFHPEADPEGMIRHFSKPDQTAQIIMQHDEEKFQSMMDHLKDNDGIPLTHDCVIPNFLNRAIESRVLAMR